MRIYLAVLATLSLAACTEGSGGSDSGGFDPTPSVPSVSMNNEIGSVLNNARIGAGRGDSLTYNQTVGRAAQIQANDQFTNNHNTEFIGGNPGNGDIGDTLAGSLSYPWEDIIVQSDQGAGTNQEKANEFSSRVCTNVINDLCVAQPGFETFGIGKAGSGSNQRWVMIITDPDD